MARWRCQGCNKELHGDGGIGVAAKFKCIKCGAIQCATCSKENAFLTPSECCKCGAPVKSIRG